MEFAAAWPGGDEGAAVTHINQHPGDNHPKISPVPRMALYIYKNIYRDRHTEIGGHPPREAKK